MATQQGGNGDHGVGTISSLTDEQAEFYAAAFTPLWAAFLPPPTTTAVTVRPAKKQADARPGSATIVGFPPSSQTPASPAVAAQAPPTSGHTPALPATANHQGLSTPSGGRIPTGTANIERREPPSQPLSTTTSQARTSQSAVRTSSETTIGQPPPPAATAMGHPPPPPPATTIDPQPPLAKAVSQPPPAMANNPSRTSQPAVTSAAAVEALREGIGQSGTVILPHRPSATSTVARPVSTPPTYAAAASPAFPVRPGVPSDDDLVYPKRSGKALFVVLGGLAAIALIGVAVRVAMDNDEPPRSSEKASSSAKPLEPNPPALPAVTQPPAAPNPAPTTSSVSMPPPAPTTNAKATEPARAQAQAPVAPRHADPKPPHNEKAAAPPPRPPVTPPPPPPKNPPKPASGAIVRDNPF